MASSLLTIIFITLCIALIFICQRAETQLKQFLQRNTTIADEKSLDEYKSVVRACMYLTVALMGILFAAFCIIAVLIWLKGISGALSVPLLGVALGFGKEVNKLEEKARSLTATNSELERRYQEISQIWVKQTLPNF